MQLIAAAGIAGATVPRKVFARTPAPIDEAAFVPIGGIQQWISIKGADRDNMVVLVLHGGPGDAWSPFTDAMFAGWDRDVTLVQWDQRGAGRTFGKNPPADADASIERMTRDGIEVAEYLTRRLNTRKIVILGGSWGGILGAHMAHARPDLFEAFVIMDVVVNWRKGLGISYARVLEMARAANDQPAVDALTALGPPPWDSLRKWPVYRKQLRVYQAKRATAPLAPQVLSPAYASAQDQSWNEAADEWSFEHFVGMKLDGPLAAVDLAALGPDFTMPVFMVQGAQDLTGPPDLAKAWFDSLRAPRKRMWMIPGTGHEPSIALLQQVRKVLTEDVRPRGRG